MGKKITAPPTVSGSRRGGSCAVRAEGMLERDDRV
nr:MAG TPA: hypothetical protein [Caudoviricetes sp.]